MKFSSIALIAAFTGHVIANPTVVEETTASTFADAPVTVTVTCDGATIDWPKLSLSELTIAGTALIESYNAVHVDLSNDDSQLRDLVYSGTSNRRMVEEHDDTSNLGWWVKPKPLKGIWEGTWGCSECPDDDTPEVSTPVLKAWESKFIARLLESASPIFQKLRSCNIDIEPGEDKFLSLPNADIEIFCGKHIDLTKLSVSMGAFLSRAVQTAYNKVHADNSNDDSELTNVYFYKKKGAKTMLSLEDEKHETFDNLGQHTRYTTYGPHNPWVPKVPKSIAAPGLSGWWGCRLCPSDDDLMLGNSDIGTNSTKAMKRHEHQLHAASSGSLLNAWEAELNAMIQQGPFPALKQINWCDLKLVPHKKFFLGGADDVEEEEAKEVLTVEDTGCGVRGGCHDNDVSME